MVKIHHFLGAVNMPVACLFYGGEHSLSSQCNAEFEKIHIVRNEFPGEWNYKIEPNHD
ncbi:MAG: hypothetical protein WCI64_11720 [Chlorobium sp.]